MYPMGDTPTSEDTVSMEKKNAFAKAVAPRSYWIRAKISTALIVLAIFFNPTDSGNEMLRGIAEKREEYGLEQKSISDY